MAWRLIFSPAIFAVATSYSFEELSEDSLVFAIFEHAEQNLATGIPYVFFIASPGFGGHGGNVIDQALKSLAAPGQQLAKLVLKRRQQIN